MDSKILQLIESTDPLDRKKAIQMLAKMGGPEAIRTLGIIYKQDDDAEVKDLAIQAGKYIKKQQAKEVAPVQPAAAPFIEDDEEAEPQPEVDDSYEPVVVSEAKQSQARGMMDRALDLSMHGEKEKAVEAMMKAFKLNPNLRLDTYYMGIAMDVTGLDKNSTTRLLTDDPKSQKKKNKLKNDGSGDSEEVTWDTALIDLTLYYVVIVGIALVGILLSNRLFQMSPLYSDQATRALGNLSLVMGLVVSLISGVLAVGALMFHYAIMHLLATAFLSGDGTYRGLIHHATTTVTVWAGITGTISLASNYFLYSNPQQSLQASMDFMASPIFPITSVGSIVIAIAFLIWFCVKIGENYEFGTGKGCVTVMGWFASMIAISCACYFTLFSVIANAIGNMGR